MHDIFADAQSRHQFAATPVGGTVAGFVARSRKNPGAQSWSQNRGLLTGMTGIQPIEPECEEALFPADDGGSTGLQPAFNRVEGAPSASIRMSLARKT